MNRKHTRSVFLARAALSLAMAFAAGAAFAQAPPPDSAAAPLRVLITGGGPDRKNNQVAIESNVRYVDRLLPAGTQKRILFADGDRKSENVLFQGEGNRSQYRAPQLSALDGPTNLMSFQYTLATLAPFDDKSRTPLLLYFTGHGSPERKPAREQTFTNNRYDMWGGDALEVQRLASLIGDLPPAEPVTVIMVQCYSGAFSNLLFKDGDPSGPLIDRNLCGYFASVPNRTAAGCTPEINEANYRDFTSYFFAALCGIDRLGNTVTGADYNKDGRVGMNEAYAYTLIHDESIDTPVCTSDTFLRRFVQTPDDEVVKTPYKDLVSWASPAQKAALDGLSQYLKLDSEDRLATSYHRFATSRENPEAPVMVHTFRFVRLAKSIVLAHTLGLSGDAATKARFARLIAAEGGSPLPKYTGSKDVFTPVK